MMKYVVAFLVTLAFVTTAEARPRHAAQPTYDRHGTTNYVADVAPQRTRRATTSHRRHRSHNTQIASLGPVSGLGGVGVDAVGRPHGCPQTLWCGCREAYTRGIAPAESKKMGLWKAANFKDYGSASTCRPGAIAWMWHHVGTVVECKPDGAVIESGNHGHRVAIGFYSARQIQGYRNP